MSQFGQESACGWCKDKWRLLGQITPIALTEATTAPDSADAKRAFDAIMQMKKKSTSPPSKPPVTVERHLLHPKSAREKDECTYRELGLSLRQF